MAARVPPGRACESARLRVTCQCPRQRQRNTRFSPSSTAILYFILNLIFIPTFYSRSVSTFSVAFLSSSSFLFLFLSPLCFCFFVFCFFLLFFFSTSLIIVCIWESWRSMVLSLFLNPSFSSMRRFCRRGAASGSPRRPCPRGATPKSSKMCNWFEGKRDVKYGAYFSPLCKNKKSCF